MKQSFNSLRAEQLVASCFVRHDGEIVIRAASGKSAQSYGLCMRCIVAPFSGAEALTTCALPRRARGMEGHGSACAVIVQLPGVRDSHWVHPASLDCSMQLGGVGIFPPAARPDSVPVTRVPAALDACGLAMRLCGTRLLGAVAVRSATTASSAGGSAMFSYHRLSCAMEVSIGGAAELFRLESRALHSQPTHESSPAVADEGVTRALYESVWQAAPVHAGGSPVLHATAADTGCEGVVLQRSLHMRARGSVGHVSVRTCIGVLEAALCDGLAGMFQQLAFRAHGGRASVTCSPCGAAAASEAAAGAALAEHAGLRVSTAALDAASCMPPFRSGALPANRSLKLPAGMHVATLSGGTYLARLLVASATDAR